MKQGIKWWPNNKGRKQEHKEEKLRRDEERTKEERLEKLMEDGDGVIPLGGWEAPR